MKIEEAKLLVQKCIEDENIHELYATGDKNSRHQTKHDIEHAMQVMDLAKMIAEKLNTMFPTAMSEWDRFVIIPLAAYLHDIGRAFAVNDHASQGARWTYKYLSKLTLETATEDGRLPKEVVKKITWIVACHRSSTVKKAPRIDDPCWAIVVMADKAIGDEERVRPRVARLIKFQSKLRMLWVPTPFNDLHNRANFAIKKAPLVFEDRKIIIDFTIDERVNKAEQILALYGERFGACVKCARCFGLDFLLRFNNRIYRQDPDSIEWKEELEPQTAA